MKPFKFDSDRQERIYLKLKKIGPGPSEFFKDACILLNLEGSILSSNVAIESTIETSTLPIDKIYLESTTHLVAHLLREIESALRSVLERPGDRSEREKREKKNAKEAKKSHQNQVQNILNRLGFPEDHNISKLWFKLIKQRGHNLSYRAHRSALGKPRLLNEKFNEFFNEVEILFDNLLDRFEATFAETFELIDELLSKTKPTNADIKTLNNNVPNELVTYSYFFDNLKHPDWLGKLKRRGFFDNPPEPEMFKESEMSHFPGWPQSRYLHQMAKIAPDEVLSIILDIPDSGNVRIYGDFIDAALEMPHELSVKLVPRVKIWLTSPDLLFLPEKVSNLIVYLANDDTINDSIELFKMLFGVSAFEQSDSHGDPLEDDDSLTRIKGWEYKKEMGACLQTMVEAGGLDTLTVLCDILEEIINLSFGNSEEKHSDHSYIWRKSIAEQEGHYGSDPKNILVSSIVTASRFLIDKDIELPVFEVIEKRSFGTFQRIGLYLRKEYPTIDPSGTANIITSPTIVHDINMHHELFHIIKEQFKSFSPETQNKYLAIIEKGIEKGEPPSDYFEVNNRRWQYRKLLPCQGNLDPEWLTKLDKFIEEFGGVEEYPDYHCYQGGVVVGPWSPLSDEDIAKMSIEDLIIFLKKWVPERGFKAPTQEGVGRIISKDVSDNPEKYALRAYDFKEQDPTYIHSILRGFREAIKQENSFTWPIILDLCIWVMKQPRDIPGREIEPMEADPDWGLTRKAIADLLSVGFHSGPAEMPFEFRGKVWEILRPITEDPDPTPEHEEKYGGTNMDPSTLSINTTRGEAMHAVIRYILWVQSHSNKTNKVEQKIVHSFDEAPGVQEVIEYHLQPANDPSLAIRSVYGQWFPQLAYHIDREWTKENLNVIFPHDATLLDYWHAAWDTYVKFHKPYDELFELLKDEYLFAIDQLSESTNGKDFFRYEETLSQHIIWLYCRGKIDFGTEILDKFYERASIKLCERAIWYLGKVLKDNDKLPGDIIERIKDLFTIRLNNAKKSKDPSKFTDELGAFGHWLSSEKLDEKWKVEQILEIVQIVKIKDIHLHKIVTEISKLASNFPLETNLCLKAIIEYDDKGWSVHGWRDEAKVILKVGLESRDDKVHKISKEIINRLVAKGHIGFKELL